MSPQQPMSVNHPLTLGSEEFLAAPREHYAWLRAHAPVYRGRMASLVEQDVWMVSRHADCKVLLTDDRFQRAPEGGSAMVAEVPLFLRPMADSLVYKDDPDHRRLRRLVVKPFTPRAIERLGRRVEQLAHDLLDDLEPRGEIDLKNEFALPIPVTVISEMVGVPEADRESFYRGTQAFFGSPETTGEQEWEQAIKDLVGLVRDLIGRRRDDPGEDILSGLIQAEEEGDHLSDDELVAMVFTLVGAGYETTYNLITNGVVALLDHPEQLARLRADPSLMGSAVQEILRYTGPLQSTEAVTAVEDVSWHDQQIPAGAIVLPLLASANLDPDAFENPDVFDITRSPNHHLGFGYGTHSCLGANLAQLEARTALDVLLRRNPELRLSVDRVSLGLEPVPFLLRYRELPVHLG